MITDRVEEPIDLQKKSFVSQVLFVFSFIRKIKYLVCVDQ